MQKCWNFQLLGQPRGIIIIVIITQTKKYIADVSCTGTFRENVTLSEIFSQGAYKETGSPNQWCSKMQVITFVAFQCDKLITHISDINFFKVGLRKHVSFSGEIYYFAGSQLTTQESIRNYNYTGTLSLHFRQLIFNIFFYQYTGN